MQSSDRIARRLKLHDLHILMAVVQAGSMNKAAVILNMTQPAVSRSIAELERTVGVSCSIATPAASSRLPTAVRCSMAERPYLTTSGRR